MGQQRGWGAAQTKAVTAHLAFLQDFPPQPSALECLLFQVCMASLRALGPSVMCTVLVCGLVLWHLSLQGAGVCQLQSVPCCSPSLCAVSVFKFPFPSKRLWSSISAGTSQSRRDTLGRDGQVKRHYFILFFFLEEGDGAKPKTLSSQKLSPKWCFLDCEYHLPLGVLTVSEFGGVRGQTLNDKSLRATWDLGLVDVGVFVAKCSSTLHQAVSLAAGHQWSEGCLLVFYLQS